MLSDGKSGKFWDRKSIWKQAALLPVETYSLRELATLDYFSVDTARRLLHTLIKESITVTPPPKQPVILDSRGKVIDGIDRILYALNFGVQEVPVVRFLETPAPPARIFDLGTRVMTKLGGNSLQVVGDEDKRAYFNVSRHEAKTRYRVEVPFADESPSVQTFTFQTQPTRH